MLDSLAINNYRNIKELRIKSLGRVNLITGRNNTGKSAILEAVVLNATKGNLDIIYELLDGRGENYRRISENKDPKDFNVKMLSSLFFDRNVNFDISDAIIIEPIDKSTLTEQKSLSLRFVKYIDEIINQPDGTIIRKTSEVTSSEQFSADNKVGLEIRTGNSFQIVSMDVENPIKILGRGRFSSENFQFIGTRNIDREINGTLWDKIALTDKEQYVIDALKIIEPNVERIAFIGEGAKGRTTVIKLSNNPNILPLRSMGDGINRILTIILALVNSDNGYLLIDEFENGLHYSVQQKLWEIIFHLSDKLNIQVFATTHSEDCISGFERTLNSSTNTLDGKLIRLDNVNGQIKQVEFNKDELKIANDQDIEVR